MIRTNGSSIFDLSYHIVFVTKYRRKALSLEIRLRLGAIFAEILAGWSCALVEIGGEPDHMHLLIRAKPSLDLSALIGNLKSASSRSIRREFSGHLSKFYRKPVLWHGAYFVSTTGGATLETIKAYVGKQGTEPRPKKGKAA